MKDKITGIERWVYDPITGKKVKKKAAEIKLNGFVQSAYKSYLPFFKLLDDAKLKTVLTYTRSLM